MKVLNDLSIQDLKLNKKRSIVIIIGIILGLVLKIFGNYSLQVAFIIYNAFASFIIIQLAKGIYDRVEL